ncbi:MAG: hypothetical protein HYZ26_04615 [Chloroflexi bacterium]|nr:hypothetical protein [Chloroflexota bacterium]
MAIYKVSVVVTGGNYPGAILNLKQEPKVGELIKLGNDEFIITEVLQLMPPRGDFHFLHITCRPKQPA